MSVLRRGCLYAAIVTVWGIVAVIAAIAIATVAGPGPALILGIALAGIGATATIGRLRRSRRPRTISDTVADAVRPLLEPGESVRAILSGVEVAPDRMDRVVTVLGFVLWLAVFFTSTADGDAPSGRRQQALVITDKRVFRLVASRWTGRQRIVAQYARPDIEVRDFQPAMAAAKGSLVLAIRGQSDLAMPFDQSAAEAARTVAVELGARIAEAWTASQAAPPSTVGQVRGDIATRRGLEGPSTAASTVQPITTWLARLVGALVGVLLTFVVLVPAGAPDAAEVTFALSLFAIIGGFGLAAALRGRDSPRLSVIGEGFLGYAIGSGIGFVLVFF
jgi:hypothetical protein